MLATLGVIFLHVTGSGFHQHLNTYNWYVSVVCNGLVQCSVAIFVMISGTLFLDPYKEVTAKNLYRKSIKRLIIAYLFWYCIYALLSFVIAIISAHTLESEYKFLIPHFHLWFLPMLICVYALVPILRIVVTRSTIISYAILIWICYITISFLGWEIPQITNLFDTNIVLGYSGYFLLGYYVSTLAFKRKQRITIYFLGLLGAIITIVGTILYSLYNGEADEKFHNDLSPHILMMALGIYVFIKENSKKLEKKLIGIVEYVRKDLFGIYLIHGIWLIVLNRALFRNCCDYFFSLPLITIIIFFFSLYTTKMLRKFTLLRKVVE